MSTTTTSSTGVLTISQDPAVVTVIERFDVPRERQDEAVDAARRHVADDWRGRPDFVGAAVLRSRISGNVSVYAQWRRPGENRGAAPPAPPAEQSLAGALSAFPVQVSKTFSVEFSDFSPTVAPPTLVSTSRTPAAHFGIFEVTVEQQNRMVDLARANAPRSLSTPGILAINFHRSLDGTHVVNFGLWSYVETDFNTLTQQPGFREEDRYWQDVTPGIPDFFDVVAVDAAT